MKKLLASVLLLTGLLANPVVNVLAQTGGTATTLNTGEAIGVCTFIGPICKAISGDENSITGANVQSFVLNRANLLLSLIFIGIIILAVFIIIQNGVKYIQSQGNEKQIEEANKAIKTVFIGFAVLFVGIIGIVLVLAFFNGTGLLNQTGPSVDCLLNPGDGNTGCVTQ